MYLGFKYACLSTLFGCFFKLFRYIPLPGMKFDSNFCTTYFFGIVNASQVVIHERWDPHILIWVVGDFEEFLSLSRERLGCGRSLGARKHPVIVVFHFASKFHTIHVPSVYKTGQPIHKYPFLSSSQQHAVFWRNSSFQSTDRHLSSKQDPPSAVDRKVNRL